MFLLWCLVDQIDDGHLLDAILVGACLSVDVDHAWLGMLQAELSITMITVVSRCLVYVLDAELCGLCATFCSRSIHSLANNLMGYVFNLMPLGESLYQ